MQNLTIFMGIDHSETGAERRYEIDAVVDAFANERELDNDARGALRVLMRQKLELNTDPITLEPRDWKQGFSFRVSSALGHDLPEIDGWPVRLKIPLYKFFTGEYLSLVPLLQSGDIILNDYGDIEVKTSSINADNQQLITDINNDSFRHRNLVRKKLGQVKMLCLDVAFKHAPFDKKSKSERVYIEDGALVYEGKLNPNSASLSALGWIAYQAGVVETKIELVEPEADIASVA